MSSTDWRLCCIVKDAPSEPNSKVINSDFDVTIANAQGIKLGTYRFKDTSSFVLDVSSLTAGIYLLSVRDRNGLRKTLKFQKL